jgi:hypothetical protein
MSIIAECTIDYSRRIGINKEDTMPSIAITDIVDYDRRIRIFKEDTSPTSVITDVVD